ncbi:MAG: hypothetical protein V3V23_03610 [Dehalococcoidales bacterium]
MLTNKLFFIKSIHTVIFIFMSTCVFYILYCGITKTYNRALLVAISAVLIEGVVLLFNKWQCPLANLAKKYGDERGAVTDMFFPSWFAPHVFRSCMVLFTIGMALLAVNYVIR